MVGLVRDEDSVERLLGILSLPLNVLIGYLKNRGCHARARPLSMSAATRPAEIGFAELAREARRLLPGLRLRRRLFWRYTLVWRN